MAQIAPPVEEALLKGYDPRLVRRLAGYFRPYTLQLLVSLVLMLLNSAAAVAGPYLVKVAIDSGIDANNPAVLRKTVLLYLLAICVQWVSIFLRVNIMVRMGQSIIYDLRAELFEHFGAAPGVPGGPGAAGMLGGPGVPGAPPDLTPPADAPPGASAPARRRPVPPGVPQDPSPSVRP